MSPVMSLTRLNTLYVCKEVCVCVCVWVSVCVCVGLCLVCVCVCMSMSVCVYISRDSAIWELKAWMTCGWGERQASSLGCKEQQGLSPNGMCQIYRTVLSHGNKIHTPWEVLSNFPWYLVEGAQVGFEDILSSCYKLLLLPITGMFKFPWCVFWKSRERRVKRGF